MAYTSYPSALVDKLDIEVEKQHNELQKLKKDKKADKNKIKEQEKLVDAKVKELTKLLNDNIVGIAANYLKHEKQIQALYLEAQTSLLTSKKALTKAGSNHMDTANLDMAGYAAGMIQRLRKVCQEDSDAYGKSWFQLRSNVATKSSKLYPAIVKNFNSERSKLIEAQKAITGKINALESLVKEAEGIAEQAKAVRQQGTRDIEDARKAAAKVAADFVTSAKAIIDQKGMGLNTLVSNNSSVKGILENDELTPDRVSNLKGMITNAVQAHKFIQTTYNSMVKQFDALTKTLTPVDLKDTQVSKSVEAAKVSLAGAKKSYEKATEVAKEIVPQLSVIDKRVKAGDLKPKKKK